MSRNDVDRRIQRAEHVHRSISCLTEELDHLGEIECSLWACDLTEKDETLIRAKIIEIHDILTGIREDRLLHGGRNMI